MRIQIAFIAQIHRILKNIVRVLGENRRTGVQTLGLSGKNVKVNAFNYKMLSKNWEKIQGNKKNAQLQIGISFTTNISYEFIAEIS